MIGKRQLGRRGPEVGALGYGAMVLEGYYGASHDDEGERTVSAALDAGMTMLDTADAYGNGHNESLVGRAVAGRRSEAFVATKFGIAFDPAEPATDLPTGWGFSLRINGRPDYAHRALEASLKRLRVDHVDLWYLHYPDPSVPIEETVGAMGREVAAGRARTLGLSNVTADEVRRAHAVHPVAAVQYEYSLWRREAEAGLLPVLRELGIALVAWAPLGSGFLTGAVAELPPGDFRHANPRYAGETLARNRGRFAPLLAVAGGLGVTPAQLALAWLLHKGPDVVPIPGTRQAAHLLENAEAAGLALDADQLERIEALAPSGLAEGGTLI